MITQIVIHLLPQEIDWFEWQIKQLKQGSYYLDETDKVIIDTTLNLNLIDWSQSQLPKQFFIDKFKQIEKLCDWCETQFIVDENNECLGCNDKRRSSICSTKADNILYLDCDLIFTPHILKYMIEASKSVTNEYYIISPQIVKLWDNSWDTLVNQNYINSPANIESYYNNDPYEVITYSSNSVSIKPINQFKFGGGWFNLLSTNLLKLTDIPDSFGPYGIDDLYVMICCGIMKQKGYNIQQHVLEGIMVIENFKYRWNPYKDYLHSINKQNEFRKQAEENLDQGIKNFINIINE